MTGNLTNQQHHSTNINGDHSFDVSLSRKGSNTARQMEAPTSEPAQVRGNTGQQSSSSRTPVYINRDTNDGRVWRPTNGNSQQHPPPEPAQEQDDAEHQSSRIRTPVYRNRNPDDGRIWALTRDDSN